ncbi:hypothetical protein E4T38_04559 [Aureobasidium subglaciale]|nr:hypothetical protein E4T38_04559 [Aureobasidium subglaciale]KAI5227412.1 hypothetical protein E4T41_04417 [Aureobasidium subglaciale]KAI5262711.1 hypothetical protein E4T46_04303 [Aureobasidium subglaciale]
MSRVENSQRPRKLRRNRRACDQCSARSVKCRPGEGESGCQNCTDYGEACTSLRPIGRRGPKPRSSRSIASQLTNDPAQSSSRHRSQGQTSPEEEDGEVTLSIVTTTNWKPRKMPAQAVVMDLTEIYFEVVYPVFPFFHRPTLLRKVSRGEYASSRPLFASVLAMCALSSARVRDGALYTGKWDAKSLQDPSSEELFEAAKEAIPHDASLSQEFDYMRAYALLAITSIQYGDTRQMNYYIGLYQSFVADENNWPTNIGHVEVEERRRLFWSTYTLDIFSSIIWGGFARSREACFNVCYPTECDDEYFGDKQPLASDIHKDHSWLKGWNFVTDLYRILEHAVDRLGHLRNPVKRTPSIYGHVDQGSPRHASILTHIMTLYEQLPSVFKATQPLTGQLERDLFGFQAANIAASLQLVRMVLFTTEHSTVDQKCQIASEVINGFASVPVAYLRAISSPLFHHLAGIGGIMGSAFENGLTESSYRRVRSVLLDLANLLANLEVDLYCAAGTSDKLRAQVSRIDEFMKIQRSVDASGTVGGLSPWARSSNELASPSLHNPQHLAVSEDSPQIYFPAELFENWSWAFDFN